jgi:isopropylmalate/homocitrate/citramalate synthase
VDGRGANPKDVQFFWQIKEEPLTQAEVVAFCSTRRPNIAAADDPMLQAILAAGTRWVTLFGKSWDLHVTEGLQTTLEENLAMIQDSIEYLRSQGRRVFMMLSTGLMATSKILNTPSRRLIPHSRLVQNGWCCVIRTAAPCLMKSGKLFERLEKR